MLAVASLVQSPVVGSVTFTKRGSAIVDTRVPAIATPPSLLLYPDFDPHSGQILLVGHEHVDSGSYHITLPTRHKCQLARCRDQ